MGFMDHSNRFMSNAGVPFDTTDVLAWFVAGRGHGTLDTEGGGNPTAPYWEDLLGNGYDFEQPTKAEQPQYVDGGLLFDGTDDEMDGVTAHLDMWKDATGVGAYIVMQATENRTGFIFFHSTGTSSTAYRYAMRTVSGTQTLQHLWRRLDADSGVAHGGATTYLNTQLLLDGYVDHVDQEANVYRDASSLQSATGFGSSGNTSNTSSQNVVLGSSGGANYFKGYIYEIIFTQGNAGASSIRTYLNNKYGIY